MFSVNNGSPVFYLFIFILPLLMMGQVVEKPVSNDHQNMVDSKGDSPSYIYENESFTTNLYLHEQDQVLNLLGNSFEKIKEVMGEPDEQGYSSQNGPHNYILYNHKDGTIIFGSPEGIDTKTAVSIILGEGQEILGAEVGESFEETKDVLGPPDSGPEHGINDLYYMDYYLGDRTDEVPEVFISFSADTIDGKTQDVFIKWEAFEYKQKEVFQAGR